MFKKLLWIETFLCSIVMTASHSQTLQPWFDSPLDGQVNSIVVSGNKAYLGGTFTKIGYACGTGAFLDTATAKPDRTFPKLDPVQGRVYASVPDGRGGWYIGGNFSYVGGLQRKYLVHVRPDHSVDSWNPAPNAFVQCLSLSGNRLYVGGYFTTIAGQTRGYGAAFDTATGALLSWDPKADGEITAMQQVSGIVYVGGFFSSLGGVFHFLLGSVDTAGTVTAWTPGVTVPYGSPSVSQFIYSNGYLYACGPFTKIDTNTLYGLAKMDPSGNVITSWKPAATISGGFGDVTSMALSNGNLYVGGSFTAIGGQSVTNLAKVDAGTGAVSTWNPAPNNIVRTVTVAGSKLFVGGDFTSIGGKSFSWIGSVDTSSGTATSWDAEINEDPYTLSSYGNILFAGGLFTSTGSVTRNNLAAMDLTTGLITPWNPNASGGVSALAAVADKVIVGGNFTSLGGSSSHSYLAAVDTSGGSPVPGWNGTAGGSVLSMMVFGNRLYLGGNFGNIDGSLRAYLAAVDKNTGAVLPWHPVLDNGGVYSFANSGSLVFTSGFFSKINGQTRNYTAAFDTTTDSLTAWNPNPSYICWSLAAQGSTVYLGGGFITVGGTTRKSIAAVDTATGALLSGFNANFDLQLNVNAILPSGNQIIIGGQFETINTLTREQLAYLDAGTGAVSSWSSNINNNIGSATVYSLAEAPHTLLVGGGQIIGVLDVPVQNFAVLTDSSIVLKPLLSASHKTIDFGKVAVGGFKDTTVVIANSGASILTISSVAASGNPFSVKVTSASLMPGQSIVDTLQFTPAALGAANATIVIMSNAGSSPDTLQVMGTGVGQAILHLSAHSVSFGNVKLGQFKDTSITITNNGSDTLKITGIASGSAVFTATPSAKNLPPGQLFVDTLQFTPTVIGAAHAAIVITSGAATSPDTLQVTGTGFGQAVLHLSAHSISFGNIKIGQVKDTTVTITNNGTDTLKIINITSSSFVFGATPLVKNVPPAQSFADTLSFSPASTEPAKASILIVSNSATSPDTVQVDGTGLPLTGIALSQSDVPDHFGLSQNFPNPFNPSTTLQYGLPVASRVNIRIYNVIGQVVAELVNGEQAAGTYGVKWTANVSSGLYFYRIDAVSVQDPNYRFAQVMKMLLLK
ncbi:MAG: choice-of-anchor D domain-containing protein [Bacteroidota bacterium]